jgi:hypothetical protein
MPDDLDAQNAAEQAEKIVAERTKRAYAEYAERDLEPYLALIVAGMLRATNLVKRAIELNDEASDEVLRAVVVLMHAYLEDFLRTLALILLPIAGEDALNDVPLAGLNKTGRAEKFFLGKLVRHREKGVDDLIKESVAEHLERSTFNSVTEVMAFLDGLGLQLPRQDENMRAVLRISVEEESKVPSALEAMMQRRHYIVHRADKAKHGSGLQSIDANDVLDWLRAATYFMTILAKTSFFRQHPVKEFAKRTMEEWKPETEHPEHSE